MISIESSYQNISQKPCSLENLNVFPNTHKKVEFLELDKGIIESMLYFGYFIYLFIYFCEILLFRISYKCVKIRGILIK